LPIDEETIDPLWELALNQAEAEAITGGRTVAAVEQSKLDPCRINYGVSSVEEDG